jgi:hypothetical protein
MKATFFSEFSVAARQGPRLFFAPLVGAVKGVRDQMHRIAIENAKGNKWQRPLKAAPRHRS